MNKTKNTYLLDFTKVQYFSEMHRVIKKALLFPDYYGCNWSAFWDCLTDMIAEPMYIKIIGLENIEKRFGDAAQKILEILHRAKHCHNNQFATHIQIEIIADGKSMFLA